MLYRCPSCGGDIIFSKVDDGGYTVTCSMCELRYMTSRKADSKIEAFFELEDAFERGAIEKLSEARRKVLENTIKELERL